MCEFRPGDEVVCVKSCSEEPILVFAGEIYTVADVVLAGGDVPSLILEGVFSGNDTPVGWRFISGGEPFFGFDPARFRKVQRRDLTARLAIENTIEEPKRVPAKERV